MGVGCCYADAHPSIAGMPCWYECILFYNIYLSDFLREECQEKPFLAQATDLKVALSGRASKALMMDCDGIELSSQAATPNLNMARRYQKIY